MFDMTLIGYQLWLRYQYAFGMTLAVYHPWLQLPLYVSRDLDSLPAKPVGAGVRK